MTIEELKALANIDWDAPEPYDDDRHYSDSETQYLNANAALWRARHEILALAEAVERVKRENTGGHIDDDFGEIAAALTALNARLASL